MIGGGPAGLMACEELSSAGVKVHLFDGMPSVGAKFLVAGRGGLNLTHDEPLEQFLEKYGSKKQEVRPWLEQFGPGEVRRWAADLGFETFVGTSGKVFPKGMEALPLLRAWVQRLTARGVLMHTQWRWTSAEWVQTAQAPQPPPQQPSPALLSAVNPKNGGLGVPGTDSSLPSLSASGSAHGREGGLAAAPRPVGAWRLRFLLSDGTEAAVTADAVLLALGGASWPKTGSDGAWRGWFESHGIHVSALRPANCGFEVHWSDYLRSRFEGEPIKTVVADFVDSTGHHHHRRGECLLTAWGLEGSLIYALSAPIRDTIQATGHCDLALDLLPDHSLADVKRELAAPRGSRSLSSHLARRLGLKGVKACLLHEGVAADDMNHADRLAARIKALPLRLTAARPLEEAISTAGGVSLEQLDSHLMVRCFPGLFCAGEMLDWEAPTGGYLLTACMASGRWAGLGIEKFLASGGVPA